MRRSCAPQRDGKWMRLRAFLLGAALLALFGVVLLRAAKVQLLDRSRLARLQRDQTRRELEWAPRRGMIVDRRGEPLAVTQDVDSVFADPSAFETPRARQMAAARIAGALRLDRARVLEKLSQPDRRFVWIKRRIDEASAQRVRGLAIDGIELAKEPKRFYPQRDLAGHVLGFVGEESGQEGLERELDQHLRAFAGSARELSLHGSTLLRAIDWAVQPVSRIEVAGPRGDGPACDMHLLALQTYRPRKIVVRKVAERPAATVCVGTSCSLPVSTAEQLAGLLEG